MQDQALSSKTKCTRCGALVECEDGLPPGACEYCGSPLEIAPAGRGEPELIAYNVLDATQVRGIAQGWLKNVNEDVPDDLGKQARITAVENAYWPFYLISGVYSGVCPNRGTISGGFKELLSASGELFRMRMNAPAYRFFAPVSQDVSLNDLSKRIMVELFDDMRAVIHVDFCQSVLRFRPEAFLKEHNENSGNDIPMKSFSEPYETVEARLKTLLSTRARISDVFFPQKNAVRVRWPFWRVEYLYNGQRYFLFVDGTSKNGEYRGGYKPVDPTKAKFDLRKFVDADPEETLRFFGQSPDDDGKLINLSLMVGNSSSTSKCFIATAAYGSPSATEVIVLRRFRDRVLLATSSGRRCVQIYYALSPLIARLVARVPQLRSLTRTILRPIVRWCEKRTSAAPI